MKNATVAIAVSVMLLGFAPPVNAQCGVRIGEWAYGPSYAATGDGTVAVYGSGRMLMVASVEKPQLPAVLGSPTLQDVPKGIVLDGDTAFVTVDTRAWDFGDGGTSGERFPTHVWTAGGSFVAYASVVDNTSGDPVYIPAEPVGD